MPTAQTMTTITDSDITDSYIMLVQYCGKYVCLIYLCVFQDLEKMLMDMQKQAELNATLMADAPSSAVSDCDWLTLILVLG